MKKEVVFKTKTFPTGSETFVVSNVVEAIKSDFYVTIITDVKNNISKSSQEKLVQDYMLLDKTLIFSEPKGKVQRYLQAIWLLTNPVLFFNFIRYIGLNKKKSLTLLFRLAFYYPHRTSSFHVHFANTVEPLLELKKIGFLESKIIVTFHGYDAHYLPVGKQLDQLKEDFSNFVDKITVNSSYLKNKLINKGFAASKIDIVPIGIDTSFFSTNTYKKLTKYPVKIITVARLVELKGIHFGLQAVKKLIEKGYNLFYTIVGEGPEEVNLKKLAKSLGIQNNVCFLGKKNQLAIKELLEENHLFLMPSSKDKDGRREAFGVVSLEAQSMGLPVIGFDSGGFPETILDGQTGFVVPDQDVQAMADKMEFLIKTERTYNEMSRKARVQVQNKFSIVSTFTKYESYY